MQNSFDKKASEKITDYSIELDLLSNKIMTMSGYILAMRSQSMRDAKKNEEILKNLVKQTYDIRGSMWVCFLTIWFLTILFIERHFY